MIIAVYHRFAHIFFHAINMCWVIRKMFDRKVARMSIQISSENLASVNAMKQNMPDSYILHFTRFKPKSH